MNRPPWVWWMWAWLAGCWAFLAAVWGAVALWGTDRWSLAALVVAAVVLWLSGPTLQSSGNGSPVTHDRVP